MNENEPTMMNYSQMAARVALCLVGAGMLLFTAEVQAQASAPANVALGKDAYMVRLQDNLPPASYGNDGHYSTAVRSANKTVDAYWEVDLDQTYALHSVVMTADDGFGDRMTHATVRFFDDHHDSVFSLKLNDFTPPVFTVQLPEPVTARYVRVGFENKERTSPTGGIEWYLGIKEVEVYGIPSSEVGLFWVDAIPNQIDAGQQIQLSWQANDLAELTLYSDPYTGSFKPLTNSDGYGSFPFSPETSQEYILVADRLPETTIKAVTVQVNPSPSLTVRINEFMAQNRQTIKDGNGNTSDWIELYNPLNEPVEMTGYGLSDDPNDPMQWVFPDVNIPAHSCLLVFASGDSNTVDRAGFLHANWKLNAEGDSVVLTAPDGITVMDQILDYPAQREDLAYGRDLKHKNALAFLDPTPGQINVTASYEGWLHPVVFSHERGFYDHPFNLSILNLDPNALTLMSLDDFDPTVPVPSVFELPIQETVTVRAYSVRQNYKPSDMVTQSYLFLGDVVASSVMRKSITTDTRYSQRIRQGLLDLPTLVVSVSELPDDYIERPASLEIIWPDGITKSIQLGCGFARYGGSWTTFPKKNYKLKFRKAYGQGKLRAPLFEGFDHGITPVDEFDTLELRGGSHDMNQRGFYMAACFVEDSMLDMGSLNPHGRFVHLYINGTYWGQYYLRERVDDNFLASYLKGGTEDYFNVKGNDNVGGGFVPGTPDPVNRHTWDTVRALRGSFQAIKAYVDVPNLIDFMLLWFYGNCESEYRCAGPVLPGDSFDTGFKFWSADSDGFLRTSAMGKNKTSIAGPSDIFGSLVSEKDPDFMTLLAERIGLHFSPGGALSPEQNTLRLQTRMAEIQDSLIAECARWNNRTPENWVAAADTIYSNLFPGRTDQMLGYLRQRGWYVIPNPPQYNQDGGQVSAGFRLTMNSSGGTIYYTLDGSDPRLNDGSVSPDATVYVPSTSTDTLIASGSQWRYWDRGSEPVGDWKRLGFDDAQWSSGRAQLGYGDGGEATVLSYGPDSSHKYSANYFRRKFTITDAGSIEGLTIKLIRDDGAAVYLNGEELLRSNMPAGTITYSTTAVAGVGGADESNWFEYSAGPDVLAQGENVVAVEVHQIRSSSSDISFDLEIQARKTQVENAVILTQNTVVKARVLDNGLWSAVNAASFLVGP